LLCSLLLQSTSTSLLPSTTLFRSSTPATHRRCCPHSCPDSSTSTPRPTPGAPSACPDRISVLTGAPSCPRSRPCPGQCPDRVGDRARVGKRVRHSAAVSCGCPGHSHALALWTHALRAQGLIGSLPPPRGRDSLCS